jgi:hypothetical protein
MTVDCIEAIGDSSDIFRDWDDLFETVTWNAHEITVHQIDPFASKAFSILQTLHEENKAQSLVHRVDLIEDDTDEESAFEFAPPCPFDHELILASLEQLESNSLQCGFLKKVCHAVKKAAKKTARVFKKAVDVIAHGTKKAAGKVADFVKNHKKETLIAAAVIVAIAGAFIISGALGGVATTRGTTPTRKKENEEDNNSPSSSPPLDPPLLPDWISDLLKSTVSDFSPDKLSEASLDIAKKEAHDAWDLFNRLKTDTENSLASLKEFQSELNPSSQALETILNSVLQDPQKYQNFKNLTASQSWMDIIKAGHEKIDQAFATLSSRNQTPINSSPNFFQKIQLGLEIIGRSMIEPELLDPNSPLDHYFNEQKKDVAIEKHDQTIVEFFKNIEEKLKNEPEQLLDLTKADISTSQDSSKIPKVLKMNLPLPLGTAISSSSIEKSKYFKIEGTTPAGTLITFINGMGNVFENAESNAKHLQKLCPSKPCIEGIYNPTNGAPIDLLEIFTLNYRGYSPNTQDLLIQKWCEFHEQNKDKSDAKILHFCHSQGAIHTKNALMHLPEEIRNRVIVVAIAPAVVVPRGLCHASFNYASKNDIVPKGELLALLWQANNIGEKELEEFLINAESAQHELTWLEPDEKAIGLDHSFQSPTFDRVIKAQVEKYYNGKYQ